MYDTLARMKARYEELERALAGASDPEAARRHAREHGSLARLVRPYQALLELQRQLADVETMVREEADAELRREAQAEASRLRERAAAAERELEALFLTDDPDAERDALLEIRAGTGGEEAALFAADLCRMYQRHAEMRGWKTEVIDESRSEMGGFRDVVLAVRGEGVFRALQFESGGHRVQRVPQTEQAGRIHTSAATVAVLPEVEEAECVIRPEELRIDTFRAGGKGGQHVNKTESAVRITHLPTGLVVSIQDERSQHKNRTKAMRILRARLAEAEARHRKEQRDATRKGLIGSGDRNDRIRTYNFPQNRVTDHRIDLSLHQLDRVMEGNLLPLLAALAEYDRRLRLGLPTEKRS